jgi:hypothetical protein
MASKPNAKPIRGPNMNIMYTKDILLDDVVNRLIKTAEP